ncbi:MAG TPA: hypothetical protein VGG34_00890 [Opitutaceae bacterium]|jgi:hypothetical protein
MDLFAGRGARLRGLLFALSGAAALWLGYVAVGTIEAAHLIIACGYYYVLGVFALFVLFARRLALERREVWAGWLRRPGAGGLAILAGALFAVWSDHFQHKILYDEFDIQSTAYTMHMARTVSTVVRAYKVSGTWVLDGLFLDKRPYFLPFLVSLVHDVTGFRVANIFAVNAAFGAGLLGLLYWFTRQFAARGPAVLAVALMASLPLLGQNATGAGMDMSNLAMIALVACLGVLYLRVPTGNRLSALVLGAILLTQSRYESIIFIAPVAAVVVAGWARAGRAILPWPAVLAPLLLIPSAWHLRVVKSEPIFFQLKPGQSAFTASNILPNLRGDASFLLNLGTGHPDSACLTVLGLLGLCWAAWLAIGRLRARAPAPPTAVVGAAFGAGIVLHFCVLLCYWWSDFDDPLAARFALPLCLAFAVLAALLVDSLGRLGLPAVRVGWAALALWFLGFGLPAINLRLYTVENLPMQELDWEQGIVSRLPGPVLIITNKSTIPFLLHGEEAILRDNVVARANDLRYHMGQETFATVVVTQAVRPITEDGAMGIDPDDILPGAFHLRRIAQKRFGTRFDRVSLLLSVDEQPGATQRAPDPAAQRSISPAQSLSDPPVAALTSSSERR